MTPPVRPAVSAPDVVGPISIVDWPTAAAGSRRKRRSRPFAHVRLEVDLRQEHLARASIPLLTEFEQLLRERTVEEHGDLLRLSAEALHAFAQRGFTRVDHWELQPGGWLPLPEPTHASLAEPLGHLLRALQSDAWRPSAMARTFAVRLSGPARLRADLEVRRVHRERGHSISVDLRGTVTPHDVEGVVRALRQRLPVLRSVVASYAFLDATA
jgi:hypothetical protein